jgi:hypothetical protein
MAVVTCAYGCGLEFDDTYRWTFCPHATFEMHTTVVRPGQPDVIATSVEQLHALMNEERMQPPEGSEPEGAGFGKPWAPQPGVTFLAAGAFVRSLIDQTKGREGHGLVGVDVQGKWNHGAADTLSLIVSPDIAEEWGQCLIDGAKAARVDQVRWIEANPDAGTASIPLLALLAIATATYLTLSMPIVGILWVVACLAVGFAWQWHAKGYGRPRPEDVLARRDRRAS